MRAFQGPAQAHSLRNVMNGGLREQMLTNANGRMYAEVYTVAEAIHGLTPEAQRMALHRWRAWCGGSTRSPASSGFNRGHRNRRRSAPHAARPVRLAA
jgi:hypothetical protein